MEMRRGRPEGEKEVQNRREVMRHAAGNDAYDLESKAGFSSTQGNLLTTGRFLLSSPTQERLSVLGDR